jgi:hypothetical protein
MGLTSTSNTPSGVFSPPGQTLNTAASPLTTSFFSHDGGLSAMKHSRDVLPSEPESDDRIKRQRVDPEAADLNLDKRQSGLCQYFLRNFCEARLPSPKEIEALGTLTGKSGIVIEAHLARLLSSTRKSERNSAYRSPQTGRRTTAFQHCEPDKISGKQTHVLPNRPARPFPEASAAAEPTSSGGSIGAVIHPITKGCKGRAATDTNPRLLERDEKKRYQCTHRCGQTFNNKASWKRHEEIQCPQKKWLCLIDHVEFSEGQNQCKHCKEPNANAEHIRAQHGQLLETNLSCSRVISRQDKVHKHLKDSHKDFILCADKPWVLNVFVPACKYNLTTGNPTNDKGYMWYCGFCPAKAKGFNDWNERIDHVGNHFEKDEKCMKEWRDRVPRPGSEGLQDEIGDADGSSDDEDGSPNGEQPDTNGSHNPRESSNDNVEDGTSSSLESSSSNCSSTVASPNDRLTADK